MLDLVIIGGGPTGINCAIAATKANLNYAVLEKGVLVNSIFNFPSEMTFFSTSLKLEIGETPFVSHGDKPTRKEALEYYRRLVDKWNIKINFYEKVQALIPNQNTYQIQTDKQTYSCKKVIIATGYYDTPRLLGVPGESLPKVKHYYDEVHPYIHQKVLVIGAANSACDVALETYYKGASVTMAIRESEIYPKVKYWIRPNIENRIKEGSIQAYFNTVVTSIQPDSVTLKGPDGVFSIANDFVLAMTGYKPNYTLLKSLGIAIMDNAFKTPVYDTESLESNLPGVYLAGVICGGLKTSQLFIENTRHHGEVIIQHMLSRLK